METDVVAMGSGGSGLTAAITAHDEGCKVIVIEKSDKVGGTTAISGGGVWIPLNHLSIKKGHDDSRESVLVYAKNLAKGRASDDLVEKYIDTGPEMVKYLEENTPLKFEVSLMPDYHPEMKGAHKGDQSRTLGPMLFDSNELGESFTKLRRGLLPSYPLLMTETAAMGRASRASQLNPQLIAGRMQKGFVGFGGGLVGALYKGCLDRGIDPLLNTRGLELITENQKVVGLKAQKDKADIFIKTNKGVILASGGFEWNEDLKASFLPGPISHPNTPPSNEGDGLVMAMAVGAGLGNMSEPWGWTSMSVPGEEYDGRQASRNSLVERTMPHCIMVNREGKRFVNEAASYNDHFKSFWILDANTCEYVNIPAWHVFDQQYKDKYSVLGIMAGQELPDWVDRAETIEELSQKAGIDSDGLKSTVKRFNSFAVEGIDSDFYRGESVYDQYWADGDHGPNPALGTIEKPPFYAVPAYPGTLGTKGGPKTNTNAQVLNVGGEPIAGLYAAGNVMASVTGPSYWGGGSTIGPGMVFGYIAAKHVASR